MISKIGLGGGCHWCTEGVFQSLIGIIEVKQGWISSYNENESFSEAVLIEFDNQVISIENLIEIHLYTHASTSNHSFRKKYRSAIYIFDHKQKVFSEQAIEYFQSDFDKKIITQILSFKQFKLNKEDQLNYLYKKKYNSFCTTYIHPKLSLLLNKFSNKVDYEKIQKSGIPISN